MKLRLSVVALLIVLAADARAQTPAEQAGLDAAAVARFADAFFPSAMRDRHIPGAVFVFVHAGRMIVARGYGASQLDPYRAVDPERTAFRLASTSKTLTATAALQLVERGQIALHEDVNRYLRRVRVRATHGPVTLHHLLTHTAGFDDRLIGLLSRSPAGVVPLAEYLAQTMPPTFIAPGQVISYSNHGYALIGLLIEDVTGRRFADYVRDEIFAPLGMFHSGVVTDTLPPELAVAYHFSGNAHRPLEPEYLHASATGGVFATGTDIARFLIAHLRGGAFAASRILQPQTLALMHAQHFVQPPTGSGWAYGLWEDLRGGDRALVHDGGGKGYRALLYLLPSRDAGFFVAYNLADRHPEGELLEQVVKEFRRSFMTPSRRARLAPVAVREDAFAGAYVYVRRARTTIEQPIAVLNQIRVVEDGDRLRLTRSSGQRLELVSVGPDIFRGEQDDVAGFDDLKNGRFQRLVLVTGSGFPMVYERLPWLATRRVQLVWLGATVVVFLYVLVRRSARWIRRRRSTGRSRWLDRLTTAGAALNLLFLVAFPFGFLGSLEGGVPEFAYGLTAIVSATLVIPPVTGVIAIVAVVHGMTWWWRDTPRANAIERIAVVSALMSFTLLAWYWGFLSFLAARTK